MIPTTEINRLKSHVTKYIFSLDVKIKKYIDIIDGLNKTRFVFREGIYQITFSDSQLEGVINLERLADSYRYRESERVNLLREIDNITAIIVSNLALALDECLEQPNVTLRIWIRQRIEELVKMRLSTEKPFSDAIYFPTATAILSPYLFKTQTAESPIKFAGIRNAIRELINN